MVLSGLPATAQDAGALAPEKPVTLEPVEPATVADPPPVVEGVPEAGDVTPGVPLPPAESAFQEGVRLYRDGLFSEALEQFTRALAIDPGHQQAAVFKAKSEAKLRMQAAGENPVAVPAFQTLDPQSIPTGEPGKAPLSIEEVRVNRLRSLIEDGQFYLENKKYERAQKLFEDALLIDPNNKTATHGYREATKGVWDIERQDTGQEIEIDRARQRAMIEQTKQLPEGANAKGIKPWKLPVEVAEENVPEISAKRSRIEDALESTIEFLDYGDPQQGVHLNEIINYLAELADINIQIDWRVVDQPIERTQPAEGAGVPGVPGGPGGFPGAPGGP
ncbi:hypothetical protein JXD38_04750, partial [candidate division WOR-3 bacterium]|nr:hypothetical protein [candidate division WOR-3 bacterium]